MKYLLLLTLASAMWAQQLTLNGSTSTVTQPGAAPVTVTVGFTDATPSAGIAAMQWGWSGTPTFSPLTPIATAFPAPGAPVTTLMSKTLLCVPAGCTLAGTDGVNTAANSPGVTILQGPAATTINANTLGISTPVATFTITPPTTAGIYTLTLVNPLAVDPNGAKITIGAPPTFTLTVVGAAVIGDLNGDGVVNNADIVISIAAALNSLVNPAATCPAVDDLDGDGKCTVADVEMVIKAAGGVAH